MPLILVKSEILVLIVVPRSPERFRLPSRFPVKMMALSAASPEIVRVAPVCTAVTIPAGASRRSSISTWSAPLPAWRRSGHRLVSVRPVISREREVENIKFSSKSKTGLGVTPYPVRAGREVGKRDLQQARRSAAEMRAACRYAFMACREQLFPMGYIATAQQLSPGEQRNGRYATCSRPGLPAGKGVLVIVKPTSCQSRSRMRKLKNAIEQRPAPKKESDRG